MSQPSAPGRPYRADLVRCLAWASVVLAVAFAAVYFAGVPMAPGGARWLALPAAALAAAVLTSAAVFLLRPLRRHALGWALTGAGIAAGIGVPLGCTLAVLYDALGFRLFGVPREAVLDFLPRTVVAVLLVGGGIGGYLGFRERTGSSVF